MQFWQSSWALATEACTSHMAIAFVPQAEEFVQVIGGKFSKVAEHCFPHDFYCFSEIRMGPARGLRNHFVHHPKSQEILSGEAQAFCGFFPRISRPSRGWRPLLPGRSQSKWRFPGLGRDQRRRGPLPRRRRLPPSSATHQNGKGLGELVPELSPGNHCVH